jgi:hypothetical protein
VLCVVAQHTDALDHFVAGLDDGLSHLESHGLGDGELVLLDHLGHRAHELGALFVARATVGEKRAFCQGEPPLDLRLVMGLEGLQGLARRRVHR